MTPAEDPRVLAAAHAMYRQAMRLERLPDEIAEHHWNLPPDFNSDRPYYCRLALQVLEAADAAAVEVRMSRTAIADMTETIGYARSVLAMAGKVEGKAAADLAALEGQLTALLAERTRETS